MKVLRIYFVGGSKLELDLENAETIADNIKTNGWVEVKGFKIQSANVAYVQVFERPEVNLEERRPNVTF